MSIFTESFSKFISNLVNDLSTELIFIITMVLLLISTIPCNFAWYHFIDAKSSNTFFQIFGISMLWVMIEYSLNIPANEIGSKRFTIFQLTLMSYTALLIGTLLFLYIFKDVKLTLTHFLASLLSVSGLVVAFM